MPFKSKAQARAAFGGFLGAKMKAKAPQWEDETPGGIAGLPKKVATPGLGATRFKLRQDRSIATPKRGKR